MDFKEDATFYHGVCWNCKAFGDTVASLRRCGGCQLVAYCNRDCQKDNRIFHKYVCKKFPVKDGKNVLHTNGRPWEEHIASLLERSKLLPEADSMSNPLFLRPWVCNTCHEADRERLTVCKCSGVSYCSRRCSQADNLHKSTCNEFREKIMTFSMNYMRLAYPRSLLISLRMLPEKYYSRDSLVVHVIVSKTMVDYMCGEEGTMRLIWKVGFAQELSKLKHLSLVFIMQNKANHFKLKKSKDGEDTDNCEGKGPIITYSFLEIKYHMFYSSENYTKPDIVAIYGNKDELYASEMDHVHRDISYCNMTYSRDTLVFLMDATMDLVKQGARDMNTARPVEQVLAPQINTMRGFTLFQDVINEKYYFTCVRRK